MSNDHSHQHQDPFQAAMTAEIANRVRDIAPYIINKAIYGAMAASVGAIRESSYRFYPIDPEKLLADPHPLDVRGACLPSRMGVLLHDRLLHTSNSYLGIVLYGEDNGNSTFNIFITTILEEGLSKAPSLEFDPVIKNEVTRQIANMPPLAAGAIRLVGMTIVEDYFPQEHIDLYWNPVDGEPAAKEREAQAQQAVQQGLPVPEVGTNRSGRAENPAGYPTAAQLTPATAMDLGEKTHKPLATKPRPTLPGAKLPTLEELEKLKALDPTKPRATPESQLAAIIAAQVSSGKTQVASSVGSSAPDVAVDVPKNSNPARPAMPKPTGWPQSKQ